MRGPNSLLLRSANKIAPIGVDIVRSAMLPEIHVVFSSPAALRFCMHTSRCEISVPACTATETLQWQTEIVAQVRPLASRGLAAGCRSVRPIARLGKCVWSGSATSEKHRGDSNQPRIFCARCSAICFHSASGLKRIIFEPASIHPVCPSGA